MSLTVRTLKDPVKQEETTQQDQGNSQEEKRPRKQKHQGKEGQGETWDGHSRRLGVGCTPRGSCNRTLLRRVLRRFFKGSAS